MSTSARVIVEYESGVRVVGPILRLEGQGIQVGLKSAGLDGPVTVWLPGSGSLGSIRFASFARAKANSIWLSTDRLGARGRQRLRELQERAASGEAFGDMRSPPPGTAGGGGESGERARRRTPIPQGGVVERVRQAPDPARGSDERTPAPAAMSSSERAPAPAARVRKRPAAPAAAVSHESSPAPAAAVKREPRRSTPSKGIRASSRSVEPKPAADSDERGAPSKRAPAIEVRMSTVPVVQCDTDMVRRALAGPSRLVDLRGVDQRAGRPVLIELEAGGRLVFVEGEVQSKRGSACRLRLRPNVALADLAG